MSSSISSFRMLIDIKRSEWIDFKKELYKEDKQRFDRYMCTNNDYSHKGIINASQTFFNQNNIQTMSNEDNQILVDEFYDLMKLSSISDKYQNNNLKTK